MRNGLTRNSAAACTALLAFAAAANAQVSYQPGPNNPNPSNESASGTGIPALQAQISVGGVEPAVITSMTIDHSGTLDDATDIAGVHLYVDVNGNGWLDAGIDVALSTGQTFSADNGTITFGSLTRTISNGASELWLVVVDLNGNASSGENWRTHLGTSTTFTAVGATTGNTLTVSGVSVNSGSKQIDPNACTLTLLGTAITQPSAAPMANDVAYPMARLELRASTSMSIGVSAITFTASGTGDDLMDVKAVRLFRDSNADGALTVGTDVEIGAANVSFNMDDGTAPFTSLNETVPAGGRIWLIVAYDWAASIGGGTYAVSVASASDITRAGMGASHSHGTTSSCQLHGPPTVHAPTTVPTAASHDEPHTRPPPRRARHGHNPAYCHCGEDSEDEEPEDHDEHVLPPPVLGSQFLGELLLVLLAWWPLVALAAVLWRLRQRRPAPALRRAG